MKDLYELKKMLIDLLNEYSRQRDLSASALQMIDTLAHACKNVCKIIEFCEKEQEYSEYGGRSYADRSYMDRSYADGRSYGDYYDGGMSERRGRAANGRFVSRDGAEVAHKLRDMLGSVPDESTKREIQRLADKMESM